MYGLVNRAIEQLVVSLKGENGWRGVCAHANISSDGFVSMHAYDDEITYRLVNAVSARLELEPATVLEAFGEYWVTYTPESVTHFPVRPIFTGFPRRQANFVSYFLRRHA